MTPFCIYYQNKAVYFAPAGIDGAAVLRHDGSEVITPAKLLKNLENNKSLCVVSDDPERAFAHFCAQFEAVEAAGGVVENAAGEILMMHRRGWWDLPKGHVEPGETTAQAALREVEEETGLTDVRLGEPLTTTQHFYDTYGRWEMKRTWWYRMRYDGAAAPVPQTEEGITEIGWMRGAELWSALGGTYATIRNVMDAYVQTKE